MRVTALLAMLWLIIAGPALAQEPRVGPAHPIGDTGLHLALWYGDGIIAADPVRAVVLDDQGRLHAASPLSVLLQIDCKPTGRCIVWDRTGKQAFTPEAAAFKPGQTLVQGDKVLSYPDHDYKADEFGFTVSPMTLAQHLRIEGRALLAYPLLLLAASVWWFMLWLIPLGTWRFARNARKWSVARWLLVIATTVFGGGLMLISASLWLMTPTTPTILVMHMAIGAILAWLALRAWQRRAQTEVASMA